MLVGALARTEERANGVLPVARAKTDWKAAQAAMVLGSGGLLGHKDRLEKLEDRGCVAQQECRARKESKGSLG